MSGVYLVSTNEGLRNGKFYRRARVLFYLVFAFSVLFSITRFDGNGVCLHQMSL